MDPFEVRMQFLQLLRRLNASQLSIQKTVSFAIKYSGRCGEDLWGCIIEECEKATLNMRINLLYLLDALCETSSTLDIGAGYPAFVARDLGHIVRLVVPETKEGLMNLLSTRQIIDNWRAKRVIDSRKLDTAIDILNRRKEIVQSKSSVLDERLEVMTKNEVLRRIEEDRERHKRLRERRWVLPAPPLSLQPRLATSLPASPSQRHGSAVEIEFDNAWETTSDWNEDDDDAVDEENSLCFPGLGLGRLKQGLSLR